MKQPPESTIEYIYVISVTDKDSYDIPMAAGYTEDSAWALFDRVKEGLDAEYYRLESASISLIDFDSSTD